MAKAKKVMSPAAIGLKKLLKGDFTGFDDIHKDAQHRLVELASLVYPHEKDEHEPPESESTVRLEHLVSMIESPKAIRNGRFSLALKRLRATIRKEIGMLTQSGR